MNQLCQTVPSNLTLEPGLELFLPESERAFSSMNDVLERAFSSMNDVLTPR